MREFLLNSESVLDPEQVSYMNNDGQETLLPCRWIHFNDRIKLAFFPENCSPISMLLPQLTLDEVCQTAKNLLDEVMTLENIPAITLENMVWDMDAIYLMQETGALRLLYMPILPDEAVKNSGIYVRRIYALLEEMLERVEGGETIIRQIEYQKTQDMGNWNLLKETLDKRIPMQSETIRLIGMDKAVGMEFSIGTELFRIGSDENLSDVVLEDEGVGAVHAVIGWNDISFYVMALEHESGTWLNDTKLTPNTEIPIGAGNVIRIAGYSFLIEA